MNKTDLFWLILHQSARISDHMIGSGTSLMGSMVFCILLYVRPHPKIKFEVKENILYSGDYNVSSILCRSITSVAWVCWHECASAQPAWWDPAWTPQGLSDTLQGTLWGRQLTSQHILFLSLSLNTKHERSGFIWNVSILILLYIRRYRGRKAVVNCTHIYIYTYVYSI